MRVAVLCMHTSPVQQPGSGDGGGLNVYVRELTTALAHLGVDCDIYTRRAGPPKSGPPEAGPPKAGISETGISEAGISNSGLSKAGLSQVGDTSRFGEPATASIKPSTVGQSRVGPADMGPFSPMPIDIGAADIKPSRNGSTHNGPATIEIESGVSVTQVDAGAPSLHKEDLPAVISTFADNVGEHLARRPVDAIHAHYWLSGVAGHELKHHLGVPLAVTFHTLGRVKTNAGDAEPRHRVAAEQRVIDCADTVFTSGDAEALQLRSLYGAPPERLHVLTPGVDRAIFAPGQRHAARSAIGLPAGPMLLFVGRLQPLKGAELAIETLAATRAAAAVGANAQLVIVGGPSGPDGQATLNRLKEMADELAVARHVRFVDPLPHHLLSTYYRAADVCLVPSRSESFGLVALEAAACGTPVVSSDVGGLRDNVVDGRTGYLVVGRDGAAFAGRVIEILADPLLALRLGDAGSRRAERFSWRASAVTALKVLQAAARRDLIACV